MNAMPHRIAGVMNTVVSVITESPPVSKFTVVRLYIWCAGWVITVFIHQKMKTVIWWCATVSVSTPSAFTSLLCCVVIIELLLARA